MFSLGREPQERDSQINHEPRKGRQTCPERAKRVEWILLQRELQPSTSDFLSPLRGFLLFAGFILGLTPDSAGQNRYGVGDESSLR